MEMVFVKPASGGRVLQPERHMRAMPAEGDFVPLNSHYERLLLTGDVLRADPPAPVAALAEAAPEPPKPEPEAEQPEPQNPSRRARSAGKSED